MRDLGAPRPGQVYPSAVALRLMVKGAVREPHCLVPLRTGADRHRRTCSGGGNGECAARVRAAHRRRDRAGDRRIRVPLARARRARARPAGRAADRHPGRARHLDAQHHQGHRRFAGAGGGLRRAARRASGERRDLHPLRGARRGDGACHQPRRGDADRDRPAVAGKRAGAGGPRRERRLGSRGRPRHVERQAHQRRFGLHPQPRPVARPRRRMGRAGGARVGQPERERRPRPQGHRPGRRRRRAICCASSTAACCSSAIPGPPASSWPPRRPRS